MILQQPDLSPVLVLILFLNACDIKGRERNFSPCLDAAEKNGDSCIQPPCSAKGSVFYQHKVQPTNTSDHIQSTEGTEVHRKNHAKQSVPSTNPHGNKLKVPVCYPLEFQLFSSLCQSLIM